MPMPSVDAIVIGAGPNGLVAANALVDAGWDVLLLEANPEVGGAVRSAEVTAPGFVNDLFSAFYPLAAASPVIKGLDLGDYGLTWRHAEAVMAHPLPDGRCAQLSRSVETTAASLEQFAPGDGASWIAMYEGWQIVRDSLLDALFTPFPPIRSAIRLIKNLPAGQLLDLARLAVLPSRRLAQENFKGDGGALLLTGHALHADAAPDAAGSGIFGWLLAMLGQDVGFPVPEGGAGKLAHALESRFVSRGGQVRTDARVTSIVTVDRRAVGVRTEDGSVIRAKRAVLADVAAPNLYRDLVGLDKLPQKIATDLNRFQWDHAILKLNWALDRPIPWQAAAARPAGTVHLGVDVDGFVDFAADLSVGRIPEHPFMLLGQMTTSDPTRSPAGTESVWAYTHLPHERELTGEILDAQVGRMEAHIEELAPGFKNSVIARSVQSPSELQSSNANLVGGAVNGGTASIHQQLIFRPTTGLGRPETPVENLFLASASAHPGGGVHGACGWNAAQAALSYRGLTGGLRRTLMKSAWGRLLQP